MFSQKVLAYYNAIIDDFVSLTDGEIKVNRALNNLWPLSSCIGSDSDRKTTCKCPWLSAQTLGIWEKSRERETRDPVKSVVGLAPSQTV